MKKYTLLFTGCLLAGGLFSVPLMAQKKKLSLEESITNPSFSMPLKQIHGFADGSWAEVVSTGPKGDALVKRNGIKTDTLLFARDWKEGKKSFPRLSWKDGQNAWALWGNELSFMHLPTRNAQGLCTLPEDAENQDVQEKTMSVAYTKGNNLFIRQGEKDYTVSAETDENIVSGQSVHRNEYGITKGTFWSPDGNLLAFYRMDQRMVTDYPLVELGSKPATLNNIKYPMAGQASHHVTIGVYNWAGDKITYLQTGEPREQYLTNISWTPDEQFILVAVVNRDQNEMKLNQYRVADGSFVKTLFTESDPQWVEPEHPAEFIPGRPTEFIWHSERNGYNQLYHYNLEGRLIKALCPEKMIVTDFNGFTADGKSLFVTVSEREGLDRRVWKIALSGKAEKIQMANGTHRVQLNRSGTHMLAEFSSAEIPNVSVFNPYTATVRRSDGSIVLTLQNSEDPTLGYKLPKPSIVRLSAADGTTLNGRLYMPTQIEAGKKYPVVVYVYGGPHAQMVTNSWMAGGPLWMSWLAAQGYIVWTLDNRGSAHRGLEFEQVIHRRLGSIEMEDQLRGIEYLKTLPMADVSRMGIHGWSFGGFMTTLMMTKNPGLFKVGVAGGPVIDWALYEVMYTERYMDTPAQNPEGFAAANLLNSAKNLRDRLMLIHGTIDDVVVWQHSQEMVKKCVDEGILIDYMVYPGHAHNVIGRDRLHLYKTVIRQLREQLD